MVICTCSYCRTKQVIINGVSQPGCNVSASTRLEHEKRAAKCFRQLLNHRVSHHLL
ncbi:hypothetical protein BT96DRAFT_922907 [Gymnopus androsaceus JB14]|uniref:Uncharacterized protein n=1 Tax=Gymnopus androsaceus JB14 TaxID=1447944 RepID=A0A6A4HAF4_9AGAR|nr:hypothetical protein BT96DRAFT_922907 [Gymnopus androsaceus JB14]